MTEYPRAPSECGTGEDDAPRSPKVRTMVMIGRGLMAPGRSRPVETRRSSAVANGFPAPTNVALRANLRSAHKLESMGEHGRAMTLYRSVAKVAEARGDLAIALVAFAAVYRIDPSRTRAVMKCGEMQLRLGQKGEAASSLHHAAHESLRAGRVRDAVLAFMLAVEADPTPDRARDLLVLRRYYSSRNDLIAVIDEVANRLFVAGNYDAFIVLAEDKLESSPDHVPTLRRLMRAHMQRNEIKCAVRVIRALLAVRSDDADALERMAESFAALGRTQQAVEVVYRLARRYLQQPQGRVEAERLIELGLRWLPSHAGLHELRRELLGETSRGLAYAERTRVGERMDLWDILDPDGPELPSALAG